MARRDILMTDVWPLFGLLAHVLCEILAHAARETRLRGTNITIGQQPQGLVGTNIINIIKIEN